MLEEIFQIADALRDALPKNQRNVIKVFKRSLMNERRETARIISDELVDYMQEKGDKAMLDLSVSLYDKTMEFYESFV